MVLIVERIKQGKHHCKFKFIQYFVTVSNLLSIRCICLDVNEKLKDGEES